MQPWAARFYASARWKKCRAGYIKFRRTIISIRTPAWGVTAKIHKTVCNHLYIFAALCAFCSEITQQKTIIIRILKENTSIHCADLPENYARL